MKVGVMILNSMFLLLFISVLIGEWGKGAAIVAGIAGGREIASFS